MIAALLGGGRATGVLSKGAQTFCAIAFDALCPEDLASNDAVEAKRRAREGEGTRTPSADAPPPCIDPQQVSTTMVRPPLAARTVLIPLGGCDAFFSHSWHDAPAPKWRALHEWARLFAAARARPPLLWLGARRPRPERALSLAWRRS